MSQSILKLNAEDLKLEVPIEPTRAKSVCFSKRPASENRKTKSADHVQKQQQKSAEPLVNTRKNSVLWKPVKRTPPKKKSPYVVSVQTLTIPTTYAKEPCSTFRRRTATAIPSKYVISKQVTKLCQQNNGKETLNKLLVDIIEAEQVSDFERILNSNAILSASCRDWQSTRQVNSQKGRPRSAYSLSAASRVHHHLFQQHHDSVQRLINQYRKLNIEEPDTPLEGLESSHYENLHVLSKFYDEDENLREQFEAAADSLIEAEVNAISEERHKNFNVNLSHLLSFQISGDGLSTKNDSDFESEHPLAVDKEWLDMSANSDEQQIEDARVKEIAQNFSAVKIQDDTGVPTITYSDCCDTSARSELNNSKDVVIHLTVPTIDRIDEARPPLL